MDAFPRDEYSPHGYLDNADHAWVLRPSGVLRSRPPLGFEWRIPKCERPEWIGGVHILPRRTGSEWPDASGSAAGAPIARVHSSQRFLLELRLDGITWQVEFVPITPDELAVRLTLQNRGSDETSVKFAIAAQLEIDGERLHRCSYRLTGAREGNALWLRPSAEGLGVRLSVEGGEPTGHSFAANHEQLRFGKPPFADSTCSSEDDLSIAGALWIDHTFDPNETWQLDAVLERGHWVSERSRIAAVRDSVGEARARALGDDEAFWSQAPRLTGDWPEHWRRGWVLDLETLRMSRRKPAGIFRTGWDAMQIQVPRFVFAETMLDMAAFALADPEAAIALVVGSLTDAARMGAQLPCIREDGSPNMVALDGTVCGTSPAWCWPFLALELIAVRRADPSWLRRLVPVLERYLDFWLRKRVHSDGDPFYVCSWESGQDSSPRFACEQPTGGEDVRDVCPVDLIVGIAQAASVLDRIVTRLGGDGRRWRSVATEMRQRLEAHWTTQGYRDRSRSNDLSIPVDDVTHLAPALLGDLSSAKKEVLRRKLQLRLAEQSPALEWASFFFQLCECGYELDLRHDIAEAIAFNADRLWTAWDRKDWNGVDPMPGVALEHWALAGPRGGEGYGWGATMPLHLVRGVMGFRDEGDAIVFQPTLPERLLASGKSYTLGPLTHRGGRWLLSVSVTEGDELHVTWTAIDDRAREDFARLDVDATSVERTGHTLGWRQTNGDRRVARLR